MARVERGVAATHFCDAQADESLLPEIFARGLVVSLTVIPRFLDNFLELDDSAPASLGEAMRGLRGGTVIINMVMRALIALDTDRSPNEPCWVVCFDSMDEAMLLRGVSQNIVDLLAATFSRPPAPSA
jgi:hypothetical protein